MAEHRLDDLPEGTTRLECAMTITIDGVRRDLEQCHVINETIAFDPNTIRGWMDKVDELAVLAGELRQDMEAHMRATAREWDAEKDTASH
jgi:hypothetical protein